MGSPSGTGGEGIIYVDDLRVGTPASASPAPSATGDVVNLLANGGFEDGVIDPWTVYGGVTSEVVYGEAAEGNASLHLIVTDPGENSWNAGLQQIGHVFEAGKKYTVSAFLKTTPGSTLDIHYKPELAADPWTGFGAQTFTITDEWVEYSVTTDVLAANVDPASITFHIGFAVAEFWIDSIRFYEGDYVAP